MLNIVVPSTGSSGLTFSNFERYELPAPPGGADAEINDDLILKFDDEKDAINYAWALEDLSLKLDDKSSLQNLSINDIVQAIRNDEFVQSYLEKI
jgi:hypothetical protein